MYAQNYKRGFTLIELSIVFVVVGIILAMGISAANSTKTALAYKEMKLNSALAKVSVENFIKKYQRLPSPGEFAAFNLPAHRNAGYIYRLSDNITEFSIKEEYCGYAPQSGTENAFQVDIVKDGELIYTTLMPYNDFTKALGCAGASTPLFLNRTLAPINRNSTYNIILYIKNGVYDITQKSIPSEYAVCVEILADKKNLDSLKRFFGNEEYISYHEKADGTMCSEPAKAENNEFRLSSGKITGDAIDKSLQGVRIRFYAQTMSGETPLGPMGFRDYTITFLQ